MLSNVSKVGGLVLPEVFVWIVTQYGLADKIVHQRLE
jgi:hypothetical protein